jgi:hypothetical protein
MYTIDPQVSINNDVASETNNNPSLILNGPIKKNYKQWYANKPTVWV